MTYYQFNFNGLKKSNKKTYAHTMNTAALRDVIEWYNDGENIFFGGATLDEKDVAFTILNAIGKIELDFCMWGIN